MYRFYQIVFGQHIFALFFKPGDSNDNPFGDEGFWGSDKEVETLMDEFVFTTFHHLRNGETPYQGLKTDDSYWTSVETVGYHKYDTIKTRYRNYLRRIGGNKPGMYNKCLINTSIIMY